jgi:hypothetical protein
VQVYLRNEGRIGAGYCKFLTVSTEFDKNPSKLTYYSIGYKNYIQKNFEHFLSKLLDPQKSKFGDVILGVKFKKKNSFHKSGAPKLILSNEIVFRKILIIFDIEK